jgi:hypothetical protein
MDLSPTERSLRARLARHAQHAQGKTSTAAGTAAFLARFEREVDPEGALSPTERARRAEHARRAHMTLLALNAATARRKRATQGGPAT